MLLDVGVTRPDYAAAFLRGVTQALVALLPVLLVLQESRWRTTC